MTDKDEAIEILSEILDNYRPHIAMGYPEKIIKDMEQGLSMSYEMSSNKVADSNYTENLRSELEQAKKVKEEELERADRIYRQKLQEQRDNTRSAIGMLNREIEELKRKLP